MPVGTTEAAEEYQADVSVETVAAPPQSSVLSPQSSPPSVETANAHKLDSFLMPAEPVICGVKLRPFTATTLSFLRIAKNPLIDGGVIPDLEFHVLAFVFIHSRPVDEVRKVVRDPDKFESAVLAFGETLTMRDFKKAAEDVKAVIEQAAAANDFEVKDNGLSPPNA